MHNIEDGDIVLCIPHPHEERWEKDGVVVGNTYKVKEKRWSDRANKFFLYLEGRPDNLGFSIENFKPTKISNEKRIDYRRRMYAKSV